MSLQGDWGIDKVEAVLVLGQVLVVFGEVLPIINDLLPFDVEDGLCVELRLGVADKHHVSSYFRTQHSILQKKIIYILL